MEDVGVPAGDELLHARARRRRLWLLAAAAAVVVAFSGAGTRAPDEPADAGVTAVRPAYQGRYLTPGDVATLQAQGLATAEVLNRELACQGVELYFDTAAERDAYVADYAARFPVEPAYVDADPCRPYRDSPRYVAGQ